MRIVPEQGKGGRWRWLAYRGTKCVGMGYAYGHSDENGAVQEAIKFFGSRVFIQSSEGESKYFAGARDVDEN